MRKTIKLMKRYGSILLLLVLAGFIYRQAFLGTQSELPVAGGDQGSVPSGGWPTAD